MGKTCVVPVGLATNAEGKLVYVLCGKPATYEINDWLVCEECRATYPKQWPTTSVEGDN
jgi:hypothetical protein